MKKIIQSLNKLERKIIPILKEKNAIKDICTASGLLEIEVMRSLQWLSNKDIIKLEENEHEIIELDKNGLKYQKEGLPEKTFLKSLLKKELSLNELEKLSGLDRNEINISIGLLKRKAAIDVKKEKELIFSITASGKKMLEKESLEEAFLKKKFPIEFSSMKPEEKFSFDSLIKRKQIIKKTQIKERYAYLTELGKKIADEDLQCENTIEKLTHQMLKSGEWKDKGFRRYDVSINVPKIHGGKRHFTKQAIRYIKSIWLEMGFTEMKGTMVQTSFWDLDSLFVPQDHPAREMQDTFYIKDPSDGKIIDKELKKRIKATHENGWTTGSEGWKTNWNEKKAKENILRTHTTVLSAQAIGKLKESDLPAKFFSVGKVFRNETLDWKHLFEFYQVEGIVVDPDANMRNLVGYLTEFYKKMGYPKVRIRPAHFPYTEPSAEVEVFHPVKKQWIELGGSGIFRPEVVKPLLGIDCPVLAWGLGMGRIISEYWKITDIRELYKNDLKQIKNMKTWLR